MPPLARVALLCFRVVLHVSLIVCIRWCGAPIFFACPGRAICRPGRQLVSARRHGASSSQALRFGEFRTNMAQVAHRPTLSASSKSFACLCSGNSSASATALFDEHNRRIREHSVHDCHVFVLAPLQYKRACSDSLAFVNRNVPALRELRGRRHNREHRRRICRPLDDDGFRERMGTSEVLLPVRAGKPGGARLESNKRMQRA